MWIYRIMQGRYPKNGESSGKEMENCMEPGVYNDCSPSDSVSNGDTWGYFMAYNPQVGIHR